MSIDTLITELDSLIERQARLQFSKENYSDHEANAYGVALLDFMRCRGVELRTQLSACRTAEGAVCRMCGEAMTKEFGPVIEPAVAWDRDWLARDNWEPLPTGTKLYLHPAKAVPPCELGEICLGCEPRNADGSCPDAAPAASRVTVDEAMVSRFCETYFGGGWPGVGGQVRADVHAALEAALTTPKENAK